MKLFLIAAAMAGYLILPSAATAEADLTELFRQEQDSLGSLSGRHLKSLLTYLNLLIDAQTPISLQNRMIMNDLYGSLIREYPSMRSL